MMDFILNILGPLFGTYLLYIYAKHKFREVDKIQHETDSKILLRKKIKKKIIIIAIVYYGGLFIQYFCFK